MLPLYRLYPYRKLRWAEVGQTYIHIRRNCTLWFWLVRTSQTLNCSSKTKQRERLMRCIVYSPYWLWTILSLIVKSAFYIRTQAWGFRRCSFRQDGQCEGLLIVERAAELAPRLNQYVFCKCLKIKRNFTVSSANDTIKFPLSARNQSCVISF